MNRQTLNVLNDLMSKSAGSRSLGTRKLAGSQLQVSRSLVNSSFKAASYGPKAEVETQKLAMVADTIDQLNDLVGELRTSYQSSMKVAESLVNAIRLAESGVCDVGDIIKHARSALGPEADNLTGFSLSVDDFGELELEE
jgi:hypothetical protein